MNALLSVSDKADLVEFARGLQALGVTMYATGGTEHVLPVVRPGDYPVVLNALRDRAGVSPALRRHLAAIAFAHTAAYDAAIGHHLGGDTAPNAMPDDFALGGHKLRDLRYGENPHQSAALYRTVIGGGIGEGKQSEGGGISFQNPLAAPAA